MNKIIVNFFLINPILGLFSIFLTKNKLKTFILVFSLLIAYYGFCTPPVYEMDLYQHYEYFNKVIIGEFDPFGTKYFGMYILCYTIKFFNLPKELLPFISIFLNYYILFNISLDEMNKNKNLKNRDKIFIILFIIFNIVPFSHVYSGIRFPIAMIIAVYSIYKMQTQEIKIIKFLFLVLLSISFHKFIIFIYIIYIISYIFKINYKTEKKLRIFIFPLFLFIFSNEAIFFKFFTFIPKEILIKYNMIDYILGENNQKFGFGGAKYFFNKLNIIGKIGDIIENIFIRYFYIIYVMLNKKIDNLILVLMYVILIFYKFQAFSIRYIYILSYFLIIYIIRYYKKIRTIYFEVFTLIIVLFNIVMLKDKIYFFSGIEKFVFSIPLLELLGIN